MILRALVLCVLLCGALVAQVWLIQPPVIAPPPSANPSGEEPEVSIDPPVEPDALARYQEIVERPLFSRNRRPPVEIEEEEPEEEVVEEEPLEPLKGVLQAVIATEGKRLALLEDDDGDMHWLRPGEAIQGWMLEEINAGSAVFVHDGEQQTLRLREY